MMKSMLRKIAYNRLGLVAILFTAGIIFLSRCVQRDSKETASQEKLKKEKIFSGSDACKNCHKEIYEDHLASFHHLTSQPSSAANIKGSFSEGKNKFYFGPNIYIAAEKRDSGMYQVAYSNGIEKVARRFDFTVGSGKRGQTYLYWHDNYIFQLPLTYFTSTNEWTNSPGYSNKAQFNRPVTIRCLECHATNFVDQSNKQSMADEFSKQGIVLGVECEKCHGPGTDHINFHNQHPNEKTAHDIINPASFSRLQKLDMCRLCHGGKLNKIQPSFSFTAGDKLSDYFNADSADISTIDVHGNQYGMLAASKCFRGSQMTCNSCHDPHKNQSKDLIGFADKCVTCHSEPAGKQCKISHQVSANFLKQNCVDCHMPELPSKTIMVLRQGEDIPTSAYMRSHFISIYRDESQKLMHQLKGR
jgi:hypothetical protein